MFEDIITFDESLLRTDGGSIRVPKGYYLMSVVGADPTASDYVTSGKHQFHGVTWTFRLTKGAGGTGNTIRYFTTMKPDAQFGFGGMLKAANMDGKGFVGSRLTYAQFAGLIAAIGKKMADANVSVGAYIDDEPYSGRVVSRIMQVFSAAEYEERAKLVAANPVPAGTVGGGESLLAGLAAGGGANVPVGVGAVTPEAARVDQDLNNLLGTL